MYCANRLNLSAAGSACSRWGSAWERGNLITFPNEGRLKMAGERWTYVIAGGRRKRIELVLFGRPRNFSALGIFLFKYVCV